MSGPTVTIASIVEGEGEVRALPKLLFRLARQLSVMDLRVPTPMRVPRGKLVAAGGIERAVSAVAQRVRTSGGVLLLLDADDDCPAKLGQALLRRAQAARPDVPVCVVLGETGVRGLVRGVRVLPGRHSRLPRQSIRAGEPRADKGGQGVAREA